MIFGEALFGDGTNQMFIEDTDNSDIGIPRRIASGWGLVVQRVWGRSYVFAARNTPSDQSQTAILEFSTFNGGLIGNLRTDIRYPLIRELKFTLDNYGCSDFSMTLNALPDFPLLPGAIFSLRLSGSVNPVFQGYLEYDPDEGTKKDQYEFQGYGFRKQLKDWVKMPDDSSSVYPFGMTAGEIVDDIMQSIVVGNTNIRYNSEKIDTTAGTPIANELDFSKANVYDVFDSLALLAGCQWYIDGTGDLTFEPRSATIRKTWIIGYGMSKFDVKRNLSTVRNSIIVQRTTGRGSGAAGYAVAGVYNDNTSIAKYGFRELEYKIPGFFADAEADLIGAEILEENKDPKYSAQMTDIIIRNNNDVLPIGRHRMIMPVEVYPLLLTEDEDASLWTKTGSGDLALSNSSTEVIQGATSLLLSFTSAVNDIITLPVSANGDVQSFDIWFKTNVTGTVLRFGFGLTSWTENQTDVTLPGADRWYRWRWDVTSQLQRQIGQIGFQILLGGAGAKTVYIDSISANLRGQRHYQMEFKRATYTFSDGRQTANAEFGTLPPQNSDYISALIQQSNELAVGSQRR